MSYQMDQLAQYNACDKVPMGLSLNLRSNIENQILNAEENLKNKKELLVLLDKNPDIERVLTLLKTSY